MKPIQFKRIGGEWIDPPILLPAALPLELSGEAISSRLFTYTDPLGREMALRPDLTLAIARHHIERASGRDDAPVSYRYFGRAFRNPLVKDDPSEFDQTGFETFGREDDIAADADALSTICEAVSERGVREATIFLGDIGIFNALIDALDIDDNWRVALKRAFRQTDGVRRLMDQPAPGTRSALANALADLPEAESKAVIEEVYAVGGIQPAGGRSVEDIVNRLNLQAKSAKSGPLPDTARGTINQVLDVSGQPKDCLAELRSIGSALKGRFEQAIAHFEERLNALEALDFPLWSSAHFSVQFGRRFKYYDGFVFELKHDSLGEWRPIAAGGRYDGLLAELSAGQVDQKAVGGVVRPDRLELLLSADGGMS